MTEVATRKGTVTMIVDILSTFERCGEGQAS